MADLAVRGLTHERTSNREYFHDLCVITVASLGQRGQGTALIRAIESNAANPARRGDAEEFVGAMRTLQRVAQRFLRNDGDAESDSGGGDALAAVIERYHGRVRRRCARRRLRSTATSR